MDSEYASYYRRLYQEHWWWRSREATILGEMARLNPSGDWGRILDVGCGDGLFFPELSKLGTVEGIEPEGDIVTQTNRPDGIIHVTPFDEGFEPGHSYDLITMLDVLEHLADPVAALRHAGHLLACDGTLLATVPAFNLIWTRHDDLNEHVQRFTRASFSDVARSAGLTILHTRYMYHWLFGAKLLTRTMETVLPGKPRLPGIPLTWVNRGLTALCRLERKLLGPFRLPFGSSLLVVAVRAADRRDSDI